MRLVDLSHVVDHEMITYPGLPGPRIGEHLSFDASHELYATGTEFAIGTISMVVNTGTYWTPLRTGSAAGMTLPVWPCIAAQTCRPWSWTVRGRSAPPRSPMSP